MLNLISDKWIPVLRKDGAHVTIAPWQMADDALSFPDWPRPDLNIACLELLIGLVFLAAPPRDADDWRSRRRPDPDQLRTALASMAAAFELMGEGPRFMQDLERFEQGVKDPNGPDMLFIDSAGGQTVRNNADLLVKRGRYPQLYPALAAMALFALQAHAPAGGAGIRTSMRGGGPMVTLVDPGASLWDLIWANVPDGASAGMEALPWMRAAQTSEAGQQVFPEEAHPAEAFFGMPRRLRLMGVEGRVFGVVQRPYGANYAGWVHPLTPYYRMKAGAELLPRHPRAGAFGYRNWLGVVAAERSGNGLAERAAVVEAWQERSRQRAELIVAGWAMDKMKPRDFAFSRAPLIELPDALAERLEGMIDAAKALAMALRGALEPVLAQGEAQEAVREEFYLRTQATFEARLGELSDSGTARRWLEDLRRVAVGIFDELALPGLAERDSRDQAKIVTARRNLTAAFAGHSKLGQVAHRALGLPLPEAKKGKVAS